MTYEKIFAEVKKNINKADIKKLNDSFAFQFNIIGEGEGIFYACFKDGILSVEPYDYKDRDVIFTADAKTFIAITGGKLSSVEAVKDGKLKIEGNYGLATLIDTLAAKKEVKSASKKAVKPAAKSAAKPAAKKEAKPAAKPVAKTAEKTAAKPVVKPEVKAEAKAEVKAEAKTAVKTAKK